MSLLLAVHWLAWLQSGRRIQVLLHGVPQSLRITGSLANALLMADDRNTKSRCTKGPPAEVRCANIPLSKVNHAVKANTNEAGKCTPPPVRGRGLVFAEMIRCPFTEVDTSFTLHV